MCAPPEVIPWSDRLEGVPYRDCFEGLLLIMGLLEVYGKESEATRWCFKDFNPFGIDISSRE